MSIRSGALPRRRPASLTPSPGTTGSGPEKTNGSLGPVSPAFSAGWLVAVYLFALPFLAGLPRGTGLPILRPSEALQLAITGIGAGIVIRLMATGRRIELRPCSLDWWMLAMVIAGSIVPVLWLVAGGDPLGVDEALSALPFIKYGALYVLVRVSIGQEADRRLITLAVTAAAMIVAVIAIAQALGFGPLLDVLGSYFVSSTEDVVDGGRATTTIGSSIATGAYLAIAAGLAMARALPEPKLVRSGPPPLLGEVDGRWLAVTGLLTVGALASGQVGTVVALAVVLTTVAAQRRRLDLLITWGMPASLLAIVALWPVVTARLADVDSRYGLPESWLVRWNNLSELFWPDLAANGWLLGVNPDATVVPPDAWRQVVYLESGYLWLLWVGGVPLLVCAIGFLVCGWRTLGSSTSAVAVAGRAAVAMVAVLSIIDPHLTMRAGGDLLYVLVAASVPAGALGSTRSAAAGRWRALMAADRHTTAWAQARLQVAEYHDVTTAGHQAEQETAGHQAEHETAGHQAEAEDEMVLALTVVERGEAVASATLALQRCHTTLVGRLISIDGEDAIATGLAWRAVMMSAHSLRLGNLTTSFGDTDGPAIIGRSELRRAGRLAHRLETVRMNGARSVRSIHSGRGAISALPITSVAAAADESQPAGAIRLEAGLSNPVWKRTIDVVAGTMALVVTAPLWAVAAAAVRRADGGPVLYRQIRIGAGGVPFQILKFRTMYLDNDDSAHRQQNLREILDGAEAAKDDHDPRITPAGRWLRKLSLDELPQLINVLRSEMSLVGPRPSLVWESELFQPRTRRRLVTRPGLTGLWQVSGRADVSMSEMLELDLDYVDRIGPGLDLLCLFKTASSVVTQRGAR